MLSVRVGLYIQGVVGVSVLGSDVVCTCWSVHTGSGGCECVRQ